MTGIHIAELEMMVEHQTVFVCIVNIQPQLYLARLLSVSLSSN